MQKKINLKEWEIKISSQNFYLMPLHLVLKTNGQRHLKEFIRINPTGIFLREGSGLSAHKVFPVQLILEPQVLHQQLFHHQEEAEPAVADLQEAVAAVAEAEAGDKNRVQGVKGSRLITLCHL